MKPLAENNPSKISTDGLTTRRKKQQPPYTVYHPPTHSPTTHKENPPNWKEVIEPVILNQNLNREHFFSSTKNQRLMRATHVFTLKSIAKESIGCRKYWRKSLSPQIGERSFVKQLRLCFVSPAKAFFFQAGADFDLFCQQCWV